MTEKLKTLLVMYAIAIVIVFAVLGLICVNSYGNSLNYRIHKLPFKMCFDKPVVVDYDNDGDKDVLFSDSECNVYFLENLLINLGE